MEAVERPACFRGTTGSGELDVGEEARKALEMAL